MDFWNFFAARLEGGAHAYAPTVAGFVPFQTATNGAVALSTSVRPRRGDAPADPIDAAAATFGASDWRGVTFAAPVPRRFTEAATTTLAGRVAREMTGVDRVEIAVWRDGSPPIAFAGPVNRAGDFDVALRFPADARGPYVLSVFLVSSSSGARYASGSLSTVTVE